MCTDSTEIQRPNLSLQDIKLIDCPYLQFRPPTKCFIYTIHEIQNNTHGATYSVFLCFTLIFYCYGCDDDIVAKCFTFLLYDICYMYNMYTVMGTPAMLSVCQTMAIQ